MHFGKLQIKAAAKYWRINVASDRVCEGHCAPLDFLYDWTVRRPKLSVVLGPRGGGKSYLSALATHFDSLGSSGHQTKVLGGSEAQSAQIYQGLKQITNGDDTTMVTLTATKASYLNGSEVSYIPASSRSVRGPHVHSLRLDEVDEMDSDIRESAFGMCMGMGAIPASISMTSTWHRVGGPMSEILKKGDEEKAFPVYRFCVWEVLETCSEERSGANLEQCPECPLMKWCHQDKEYSQTLDRRSLLKSFASALSWPFVPKAKRSNGHYPIDSIVQKIQGISSRVFESDYLCTGPRADGVWFKEFSEAQNVSADAEFDPKLPMYISIDSGVFTGAVLLQFRPDRHYVTVFADYLAEGKTAEQAGLEILGLASQRAENARRRVSTDSAGGARNPVGPTVIAEYERIGLRGDRGIECWPRYSGSVQTGLATIEALVRSADGSIGLRVHPRCKHLVAAFKQYARAKRQGQWQDYVEDPQHPAEDLMDALRGQLAILMPDGRKPDSNFVRMPFKRVF